MFINDDRSINPFADWNSFIQQLSKRLSGQHPGKAAQYKLAPNHRIAENDEDIVKHLPVESSVLVVLYPEENSVYLPVILRNEYNGAHSGQISFPGGRKEKHDISDYSTALRETYEEIGVRPENMVYCGRLTDLYIPRSNFMVHPFVATTNLRPVFNPDPKEVKELLIINLDDLISPEAVYERKLKLGDMTITAPGFDIHGHFMWGATAMIFNEFIEMVREITVPG